MSGVGVIDASLDIRSFDDLRRNGRSYGSPH
jgi:hypothetical protein